MNVLWIVSDTLRRDAVGAYGNTSVITPAMDALAAKSVRFNKHYIGSFPTMPARVDHMTGRWSVAFMSWEPLPKDIVTLPQLLAGHGINTAAVVDTPFYIRHGMNYDHGFISFEEIVGQLWKARDFDDGQAAGANTSRLENECFAPRTFARAMDWLEQNYKSDFFLYLDTWDPHEPWIAPNYYTELYWPGYDGEVIGSLYGYWKESANFTEEKVRKAHATYLGEVTMVDTWLGYLMRKVENLGLMKNTAIIFTSDHGYHFGEHGLYGKMVFTKNQHTADRIGIWGRSPYYEEITRIPLLVYVPGIAPGYYDCMTSAIDLMPTVMELLKQEIPSNVEGISLLSKMKDPKCPGYDHIFSSSSFVNAGDTDNSVDGVMRRAAHASMATVTTEEWTLLYDIEPGGSELYNLKDDHKQERNIIDGHADIARELHGLFIRYLQGTGLAREKLEPRLELCL